jgi:ribosomal protein S12 methylthiotransferase accessory factor
VQVLGLGQLGAGVAHALAAAGVGTLLGVDPAPVEDRDLASGLFRSHQLGCPRQDALRDTLTQLCPTTQFVPLDVPTSSTDAQFAPPAEVDLVVLCADDFDPETYRAVNASCLEQRTTWTSARNLGLRFELGPTVVPYETACFTCYELRRASNTAGYADQLATYAELAAQGKSLGSMRPEVGAGLAAVEIARILTSFSRPVTYGSVFSFDLVSFTSKLHPVLKIPRCRDCSPAARSRPSTSIWRFDDLAASG